ncbi:2-keto-3-deoxy-D-arabino-heptulosonate-7-phosphate synthase I alpha [hydrothermal vent metagenome]|uniref:3-deoxy-7-phosphoheptulonate synthase n=1 Tax=hydrothermal vent metagenome TaxID=652676 RepID=A0A1W1CM09_9ZZZZ
MIKKIFKKINNLRISDAEAITPPISFIKKYPLSESDSDYIVSARKTVKDILEGRDKRLMVIVGPCSIHDPKSAREYAEKLAKLRDELNDKLFIVMRVYFEKPRTTVGWKGLIYDPDINNSFKIEKGLDLARSLLLDLTKMRIPTAVEYLDLITPQYFSDLITWGAIGARTTESQSHRELASGLSCPVGFKNGTKGNIDIAIDAIISASHSHSFWSINKKGKVYRYQTSGNPNCHIILRGGKKTNYDKNSVDDAVDKLKKVNLSPKVMIDFSHGNSEKQFKKQIEVSDNIIEQIKDGTTNIFGVMIESHLIEGNQATNTLDKLEYGKSITDACLGWEDTEKVLRNLAEVMSHSN